jgi:hypothetical protein
VGEALGRASRQVEEAIARAGEKPRGVEIEPMGQLPPMRTMFQALGVGLAVAVFVIFVLLTAYFQSSRLALISVGAVPGVLAGIAVILYFTNTSMNIEAFMGSIMCLGVSVSNSVMLVTFMDEHWKGGSRSTQAAIVGASERLRPILMTACAMTVGMVPMALALERGSQMQAPLGLAVIGGLVMSTFATLLVLPSIFALVIGRLEARSPSIYPDDRESAYYDPEVFAHEDHGPTHVQAEEVAIPAADTAAYEVVRAHTDDEIIGFLRSMLHEIRAKRKDMLTHHSVEQLGDTLGFAKGSRPNTPALPPDETKTPNDDSNEHGDH